MDQERDWAARMAATVGKRVAHYRSAQHRSAQQIAQRCADLGLPSLSRAVITKLENGRRETVTAAETQVLGEALGVPPILLLFPLGATNRVEILPGVYMHPWDAVRWFTGRKGILQDQPAAQMEDGNPVALYDDHEMRVSTLAMMTSIVQGASGLLSATMPGPEIETRQKALLDVTQQFSTHADALRSLRARMRDLHIQPPPISPITARMLGEVDYEPLESYELGDEIGERVVGLINEGIIGPITSKDDTDGSL